MSLLQKKTVNKNEQLKKKNMDIESLVRQSFLGVPL